MTPNPHREAGHTPGPWFVDPDDRPGMEWNRHVCAGEHDRICFMSNSGDDPRGEANARLIAAAPELYEALYELRRDPHRAENLARADNALAKARGESA